MYVPRYTISNGACSNQLLEFVSTYFPFIDEPLKITYRGRTYDVLTAQASKIEFEDFFISHNCLKCRKNCCYNMIVPVGFEGYWTKEMLKLIDHFKPRKYTAYYNDQKLIYYLGRTGKHCIFQEGKACTVWDSNTPTQRRPMGCHFYPMSFYTMDDTLIFTKHCDPYMCKGESNQYTEKDLDRDLNTFEKMCKEVEAIGFRANYRPVDALKDQAYFSV